MMLTQGGRQIADVLLGLVAIRYRWPGAVRRNESRSSSLPTPASHLLTSTPLSSAWPRSSTAASYPTKLIHSSIIFPRSSRATATSRRCARRASVTLERHRTQAEPTLSLVFLSLLTSVRNWNESTHPSWQLSHVRLSNVRPNAAIRFGSARRPPGAAQRHQCELTGLSAFLRSPSPTPQSDRQLEPSLSALSIEHSIRFWPTPTQQPRTTLPSQTS